MENSINEIKKNLKNWPSLVLKYQKPSIPKAYIQILTSIIPFIGLIILSYFVYDYSILLSILIGIVDALFLVRVFIIQHDCGHQSFFKSKKWNNFWGRVCSVMSIMPYENWAFSHNYHHNHNGDLNFREMGDMELFTVKEYKKLSATSKALYRFFRSRISILILSPIFYLFLINRVGYLKLKGLSKRLPGLTIYNGILIALFSSLLYLFGVTKVLTIHLSILITFAIIAFFVFFVQHQHVATYKEYNKRWEYLLSAIKGSTFFKLPRILQWFTGNIGFHHIHHLSPKIPNYWLEKCYTENPVFQKFITTINLKSSFQMLSNYLWSEDDKKMITFREYKQKYC